MLSLYSQRDAVTVTEQTGAYQNVALYNKSATFLTALTNYTWLAIVYRWGHCSLTFQQCISQIVYHRGSRVLSLLEATFSLFNSVKCHFKG